MVGAFGQRAERIEESLPTALRHIDVVFDEALVVRFVGKPAAQQRELVTRCESLPDRIVN